MEISAKFNDYNVKEYKKYVRRHKKFIKQIIKVDLPPIFLHPYRKASRKNFRGK